MSFRIHRNAIGKFDDTKPTANAEPRHRIRREPPIGFFMSAYFVH